MKRGLCAVCDNTNQTLALCAPCRTDAANDGWSEADEIPRSLCVSADTQVDLSSLSDESNIFLLGGRRCRQITPTRHMVLALVERFTIRVPYRNRGADRLRQPWVWRSRALNLSEIAWLVGITPQAVVQAIRFELEITKRQPRVANQE